ncbi:MAG: response regulator [Lachnospiraceae bacterium]|jgi:DNA-binding LytR/AlgR family response regulator|nr:response regulator [Lachnospiraceae bacterium]
MVNEILGRESCRMFADEEELFAELDEEQSFHVVILDIEWNGEEKGIRTAEKVMRMSPDTQILYLTGYTQKYVQKIFLSLSNLKGF